MRYERLERVEDHWRLEVPLRPDTSHLLHARREIGQSATEVVRRAAGHYAMAVTAEYGGGMIFMEVAGQRLPLVAPRQLTPPDIAIPEDRWRQLSVLVNDESARFLRTLGVVEGLGLQGAINCSVHYYETLSHAFAERLPVYRQSGEGVVEPLSAIQ